MPAKDLSNAQEQLEAAAALHRAALDLCEGQSLYVPYVLQLALQAAVWQRYDRATVEIKVP